MSSWTDSKWRRRALVAEAMLCIVWARLLVKFLKFKHWRKTLGRVSTQDRAAVVPSEARDCAAAVMRAAHRIPGTLCLPQSAALQWMLKRRKIDSTLLFAARGRAMRGGLEDLHAWVEVAGVALLDEGDGSQHVVLRLGPDC